MDFICLLGVDIGEISRGCNHIQRASLRFVVSVWANRKFGDWNASLTRCCKVEILYHFLSQNPVAAFTLKFRALIDVLSLLGDLFGVNQVPELIKRKSLHSQPLVVIDFLINQRNTFSFLEHQVEIWQIVLNHNMLFHPFAFFNITKSKETFLDLVIWLDQAFVSLALSA